MSTPASMPPGFLEKWGPYLFPGGKLFVFKGERLLVPPDWKDVQKMMEHFKYIEQLEWKLALPEQRQELFNKKLEILTRDLPVDWRIVACYVVSGVIIAVAVYSSVKSQMAKL